MIVTQSNEDLASFTKGKKLTDDSKSLHSHTHGKHLRRRDNRSFSYFVIWVVWFFRVINEYKQMREAEEYKFAVCF